MATENITSTSRKIYAGTSETTSELIGYNAGKNYVARYTFKTGSEGASSVSWLVARNSHSSATGNGGALRWYITTSSTSHINAGATTTKYHGDVTVSTNVPGHEGFDSFSGSADLVMLPNTTYYLWIFPKNAKFGCYYTHSTNAELTTSGAAGSARIGNGSVHESYQCVIGNGSSFDVYIPYEGNGSSWDLSS